MARFKALKGDKSTIDRCLSAIKKHVVQSYG